jgi:hypothetical protein
LSRARRVAARLLSHTRSGTRARSLAIGIVMTAATGIIGGSACSVDSSAISPVALPDRKQFFEGVSPFMEQRCGALDCHGQIGRPLRIYSTNGLRMNTVGKGGRDTRATQPEELTANYFSVVGLEPEDVTNSFLSEGDYTDFLLLKKPLGIEGGGVRHKGGPVLRSTDPGFDCLALWLANHYDKQKCVDGMITQ